MDEANTIKNIKGLSSLFLTLFLALPSWAAPPVSEKIIFLNQDGRSGFYYDTSRSDSKEYNLLFDKSEGRPLDEHLNNYLYIYPNEHNWDTRSKPGYDSLHFNQGSFAFLHKTSFDSSITIDKSSIYTYTNEEEVSGDNRTNYGFWNSPDNFHHFTYTWIFPSNFEIVDYKSNRPGDWEIRGNTLSYFGKNVNNLIFKIRYRPAMHATFEEISKVVEPSMDVEVRQDAKGVKVTLSATLLFPPGSTEVSKFGRKILNDLARSLINRDTQIIVEGHTDNVPIRSSLKEKFPTNWELSANRATSIIHILSAAGIKQKRLEAHAFGSTRPIASNKTKKGRRSNRRIEILIREAGS
ncbi:MAG: OmpA family protein [Gammaproteobacteria bacterium]|nr:OmpA family protein [Gammaproteobacteria bacterium]